MTLDPLYPDVVFYGAPGAGKTTALDFLKALGYAPVSFAGYHAGGVRDVAMRLGLNPNDRRVLNRVGMAMRQLDRDVWVRNAMREVDRLRSVGAAVVMDDMRGENEWDALRAAGFVRVHIVADDTVREMRLRANGKWEGSLPEDNPFLYELEDHTRYHPEHVVTNNGSQQELEAALTDILNLERSRRS